MMLQIRRLRVQFYSANEYTAGGRISGPGEVRSLMPTSSKKASSNTNVKYPFNLFRQENQPDIANLSSCFYSKSLKFKTYPFDQSHLNEIGVLGKALLEGGHENILPVLILLGPYKPKYVSKTAFVETVKKLSSTIWNVNGFVDIKLERLRELGLWYKKTYGTAAVNSGNESLSEYIASRLLLEPVSSRSYARTKKRSRAMLEEELDSLQPGLYTTNTTKNEFVPLTSSSLCARYLAPIKSIWPWVIESLRREIDGNVVIFLSGLAELLDTPPACAREVRSFIQHATDNGVLFIDGISSGRLQHSLNTLAIQHELSALEKLLAQLGSFPPATTTTTPSINTSSSSTQQPAIKISLDGIASMSEKTENTSSEVISNVCIIDGVIRAPLGLPTTQKHERASRLAVRTSAQQLIRMLEEDDKKATTQTNYCSLISELGKSYTVSAPTELGEKQLLDLIRVAPGIATTNLTISDVQRIALHCPNVEINLQSIIAALTSIFSKSSIALPTSDQADPIIEKLGFDIGKLSKHEQRFVPCIITPEMVKTRFADIGSLGAVKQVLHELITLPLMRPELFLKGIAREAISGVLLFGPPGTGKTMLAKAVAAESGSNFIAVALSSVFDMWVGEGEKNVKALFTLARKISPCVIFIDEVDALLETRSSPNTRASRTEIINEFMSEWDGLQSSNAQRGVIVMAATNRPFVLDDAVLRRLPRRLLIDLPDKVGREHILKILLKEDVLLDPIGDIAKLASITEFYSGSDLKNLGIAAIMSAIRDVLTSNSRTSDVVIGWKHWEAALKEVPASLSKDTETIKQLRKWNEQYGDRTKDIGGQGFFTHRRHTSIGFETE